MKSINSLLIIDDSEADIVLAKLTLEATERFPYIMTARDGEEALEMFRDYERSRKAHPDRFPPVLILLDINMPRMDGFELLETLESEDWKSLPAPPSVVVMLSSADDIREKKRAEAFSSVHGYITKPIRGDEAIDLAERFGGLP